MGNKVLPKQKADPIPGAAVDGAHAITPSAGTF